MFCNFGGVNGRIVRKFAILPKFAAGFGEEMDAWGSSKKPI